MSPKKIVLDVETDSLEPKYVWCVATKNLAEKDVKVFVRPDIDIGELEGLVKELEDADEVIMHNGLDFDWHVLKNLLNIQIPIEKVFDTLVAGKLINYLTVRNHALKTIAQFFGNTKPYIEDFSGGYTEAMRERVVADVLVTEKWYRHTIRSMFMRGGPGVWQEPLRLEHDVQIIMRHFHEDGYFFDVPRATELQKVINQRLYVLENEFQELWPPSLEVVDIKEYRVKADGNEYEYIQKARQKYTQIEIDNDKVLCYDYVSFAPGSPKDRVDKLWDAGWKPYIKTKGYKKWERLPRRDKLKPEVAVKGKLYARYGWVVNEENLSTLPKNAPEGARKLSEYLTLKGRADDLTEWLAAVRPSDSRIHGSFIGIGSWPQRAAHKNPNQANIFAPFHGEADTPVKLVKQEFDWNLRSLWCVPPGKVQLGCDAEGIQLRLLAHFMKSDMYRQAILAGNKDEGTDIHSLNRNALGIPGLTRDVAKTFIYAWLLNAGVGQIAFILGVSVAEAKVAMDSFFHSIPDLDVFKNKTLPSIFNQGYFEGIDGRRIKAPSLHLLLAGMLQNGESTLMKKALTLWRKYATHLDYKLLTWPHDEWQTELNNEKDANELGSIQVRSIEEAGTYYNLFCPMTGEYKIGTNWYETH